VALAAELGDGAGGHVRREGLAVPALVVLDFGEPATLDGAGQHHGRLAGGSVGGGGRGGQRLVDVSEIVAVDGQYPRAECLSAAGVGVEVPLELGGPALAEPVDIDHRDQVGQLVVRGFVEGFPDGTFSHLTVPAQHPHPVRDLIEILAGQRYPHPVGQALAQRPGRDVDPRQHGRGVAFQPGSEAPVPRHQLLVRDHSHRLVDGIQQRGGMSLGEDEVIIVVGVRLVPVVAQVAADEHGEQVGGGHAGGRVARPGTRAGPDGVNTKLCGELARSGQVDICDRFRCAAHVRDSFCLS
jgi:hypothetical protein